MNVLVAEDDPILRQMLTVLLSRREIPCRMVEDGQGAVSAWEENGFDLILMDIQMHGMDGLEATRIIRQRESGRHGHVPIVAMTAHASREDRERCRAAGMDDYLQKPFSFSDFFRVIDKYSEES